MNVFLKGNQAVPIIIAKRTVREEPQIVRKRQFVGLKRGFGTLLDKAIDLVMECFWDSKEELITPGSSDLTHYIIDVRDDPGSSGPELVVTKLDGRAHPGCGIYCEVISPAPASSAEDGSRPPSPDEKSGAKLIQPKIKRPNQPQPKSDADEAA